MVALYVNVEVYAHTLNLGDLEALCRAARAQGLGDRANLVIAGSQNVLRIAEQMAAPGVVAIEPWPDEEPRTVPMPGPLP